MASRAVIPFSELFGGYAFKATQSHAPVTADLENWLNRGKQRQAVARALTRPLTQRELWVLARSSAEKIQLRDVWAILQSFARRGLAYCLNPTVTRWKLFFWTEAGRRVAARAFNRLLPRPPERVNWTRYSFVKQGPLRRKVLAQIAQDSRKPEYRTATTIRHNLLEQSHPVGINSILRAVAELTHAKMIEQQLQDGHKVYRLTRSGKMILRLLAEDSERHDRSA